ncbi:hypothetical protein SteCoe_37866 [Stentor coeruleus]|uniref:Uncharacterized protein n=1 Tax=Stentor coeruleus TaxID=5963 RepID=A0A1R2AM89_9CILI|nr:hypothetical protein SteCoe_37866 [Stentor coeruleus]
MSKNELGTAEKIQLALRKSNIMKEKGKLIKAISYMEEALRHSKKINLIQAGLLTQKIASLCNQACLSSTTRVPFLRKAESCLSSYISIATRNKLDLPEKFLREFLITFNNWASFHMSGKNYHMALNYLTRCLQFSENYPMKEPDSYELIAKTYLNISSLYSDLFKYHEALKYAKACLEALQFELKCRPVDCEFEKMMDEEQSKFKDMIGTYVLGFYNIAIAEEGLGKRNEMKEALIKAKEIGGKYLLGDSEIMSMVNKTLSEVENAGQKLYFDNGVEEGEIVKRKNSIKVRLSQINLATRTTDFKIYQNTPQLKHSFSEVKLPGRYYTNSELQHKQLLLEKQQKLNFISADQFFFQEISKAINVKTDMKHLSLRTPNEAKTQARKENSERRVISDLRLRKQYRLPFLDYPTTSISEKIESLKLEELEVLKAQQKKIDSITNSTDCKNLIHQICSKGSRKRHFPAQRLRFNPKFENVSKIDSLDSISSNDKNQTKKEEDKVQMEKRKINFQKTKDEIEEMMEIINEEINFLMSRDSPKLGMQFHSGSMSAKNSDLYKSTLKGSKDNAIRFNIIKESIGNSMKGKKRMIKQRTLSRFYDLVA